MKRFSLFLILFFLASPVWAIPPLPFPWTGYGINAPNAPVVLDSNGISVTGQKVPAGKFDGLTDDTVAINAALATGGDVVIPKSTVISAPLIIPSNTTLTIAAGAMATHTGSSPGAAVGTGTHWVTLGTGASSVNTQIR